MTSSGLERGVLESVLARGGTVSQVLLTQSLQLSREVGSFLKQNKVRTRSVAWGNRGAYELLVQRDLVELELVDLRRGTAQQRRCCQQSERLHDGQRGWWVKMERDEEEDKGWGWGGGETGSPIGIT